MALGTMVDYFSLQMYMFGRGECLLFISNEFNMIPVLMIIILFVYAFFRLKERFFGKKEKLTEIMEDDDEPVDIETLGRLEKLILKLLNKLIELEIIIKKIFRVIKICYVPILIIAIYSGMTRYAILYTNSVRVSSPLIPSGVIYKYSKGLDKDFVSRVEKLFDNR